MRLIIGNKNYSSWSLRPWLLLTQSQIPFQEEVISLGDPDFRARVMLHSPAGKVPVLIDDGVVVWDSLAIVEYVGEKFADAQVWPRSPVARAHARAICAEMHAGFAPLRTTFPMNCNARFAPALLSRPVRRDVERIVALWTDCRARFGGDGAFLFGGFSAADAFFAPVTRRFVTYGVALPPVAAAYVAAVDALPSMQQWLSDARSETTFLDDDQHEPYRLRPE